jgi:hypothetical protein
MVTQKLWRTVNVGRWSAMLGPSVSGRLLLICHDTTIAFAASSLGELVASVVARLCHHIVNFNNRERIHV